MALRFSSSSGTSRSYSRTQTTTSSSGSTTDTSTSQTEVAKTVEVNTTDTTSGDGMAIEVVGEALAVGENTYAGAEITAVVDGDGAATSGYASATFEATGASDDGGMTYADATVLTSQVGGEERVVTFDTKTTSTQEQGDVEVWESSATSAVYALDVQEPEYVSPAPPTDNPPQEIDPASVQDGGGGDYYDASLDGNIVVLDASVAAYGEDTLVELDTYAIAIQDQLSDVVVVSVTAVG